MTAGRSHARFQNYALALDYTAGPAFLGLAFDSAQIAGSAVGLAAPAVRAKTLA